MARTTRPPRLKRLSQSDNTGWPIGLYALVLLAVLAAIAAVVIYGAYT